MTASATRSRVDPLGDVVRRIRRVEPPQAPFAATRAALSESTVLLVDARVLDDWPGWRCAGAQHVLAPADVVRRADGHDVVVPDVRERLSAACGRREEARESWHRGEVVTIVVSVLRGIAEARASGVDEGEHGSWWLAVDGRPVFGYSQSEEDDETIAEASRALIQRLRRGCDDRIVSRAIDDALEAIGRPQVLSRRLESLEETLFEAAAPQPIDVSVTAAPGRGARPARVIVDEDDDETGGVLHVLRGALTRHIDAGVGEAVFGALHSLRARWRARGKRPRRRRSPAESTGRGRLALVGVAVVVLGCVGGLLWPDADPSRASDSSASSRAAPASQSTRAPTSAPETGAPVQPDAAETAEDDPRAAATALLAAWDACGHDRCGVGYELEREGPVAAAADGRHVELVDDYGAVALLSVTADDLRQFLVIERTDDSWRIRDVSAAP
ncbi:hypothetical protein [Microbacterium sp. G2-8]|uniref:hypothetical protein n=1 Tax=Microbacterium sp. G2-8 TaxID=2842454 RepID=UPI001C897DEB|nr:hypothetical protein [Microbacterium sp. G2-8]